MPVPKALKRIKPVIVKEFLQIKRDRLSLAILILIPAFLMFMIGYALNFDVKHIKLAVYDMDRSSVSRHLVTRFIESGYFDLAGQVKNYAEADRMLDTGAARVVVVIPYDFSRRVLSDDAADVQVLIDGADSNTATVALGYVTTIANTWSSNLTAEFMARNGVDPYRPIDLRPKIWYNPELSSPKFLVPGFIGFILMLSAVVSTALSVVREKEQGTMEQLTVSPLGTVEIIIGKTVPHLVNALISSVMVLLMAYTLFHVPIRGGIFWLYSGIALFLLAALGQGMLISTFANSQQVAFTMSVLTSVLPTFILSGLVFPIRSMPVVLQWLSNITPTKFFIIVLRDVMLKGIGPGAYWHELLYMGIFAAVTLVFSAIKMSRQRRSL